MRASSRYIWTERALVIGSPLALASREIANRRSPGSSHARSPAEFLSIDLAITPWLVSIHSTPSHAGVSCFARWRKLSTPALINNAAPMSKNQVLVVSTEPFTVPQSDPSPLQMADSHVLGKVCSCDPAGHLFGIRAQDWQKA